MDFKKYLTDDVLDFWLKNGIDEEQGGIFTCLDRDGVLYGDEKSIWFQGRALWTFSKAYNLIENKPEYLEAAKKIYSFLPKCTDTDGRMFFITTRDGREVQKRRYYFSETFAAIGCAEYYKATGDEEAWEKAEKYFDTALQIFKNPELSTPKFNPENRPLKALSPVMIMLATAHVMESAGRKEYYREIAEAMTAEILHGGYLNEEIGALLENVATDGSFSDTPTGRCVNPGHSLEAAWFLLAEWCVSGNEEAKLAAKKIIEFTMPRGWDKENGGIIAFDDVMKKPVQQLEWDMKLWWPQCEAIIANRIAYLIFGDEKYKENEKMITEYAFEKFADTECGEWYGYLHRDNTPSHTLKGNIFKGPFHLPRLLMVLSSSDSIEDFKVFLQG